MLDSPGDEDMDRITGDARIVREVFEAIPAAVAAVERGGDYRLVAVNAAYRALVARDEVVGRSASELFPELVAKQLFGLLDRPFRTGETVTAREWRIQLPRASGPDEDVYFDFTIVPQKSATGEVVRLVAFAQDVTERVRDRQAAQRRAAEAEQGAAEPADLVGVLQRQLLPAGLPILPGLQLGGSYLPAGGGTAAGGDWFDAVPLPDGRTALVVGDVAGRGVEASAAMGRIRSVLEDRLDHGGDIAEALAAADRLASRLPAARAATLCVAAVDPSDGRLAYCTAGHPPPLLIPTAGPARFLRPSGGGPLGTGTGFPLAEDRLAVGDQLLLYSDGIVRRSGEEVVAGTAELARVAADVAAGRGLREDWLAAVDRLTTQTLELLVRTSGHDDDIALLAAQRTAPTAPLLLDLPAKSEAIPAARKALDEWLYDLGARSEDVILLRHAIGELVTNGVEHAYDGTPGAVRVRAECTGRGVVEIEVADDGHWREPWQPTEDRGRGLAMASDFADELRVETGPRGTTATVRHRLTRPARLLTAGELAPSSAPDDYPELLLILDQPSEGPQRIRLDGPVDAATAEQLREELVVRTRGGTTPLTVDLTGVTHLSSAGVAVLYEAETRTDAPGRPFLLYAPQGSPAQHVMSLVALPHTTTEPG
ncbi:SpoIIE family protein phosphatase [Actinomadura sp. WMMA1423]|uniref:SpoIIE family protein phosphatase n=1 Tax=Actinomadura sp. WMMA1423 TaxID=2591108 RepID=UPI001146E271|nr:SpoIIE family protein phosphatase [Actinomadura sp. WMMA1423]